MASHSNVPCQALLPVTMLLLFVLICAPRTAFATVNFEQCLADVKSGAFGPDGGTDTNGRPVPIDKATAITYELCVTACGTGPEAFQWSVFSQQFSSWLLPWLALVSQLPFGGKDKLENLISMLLTIGSPTLAAYSLALTVLNGGWIARHFSSYTYPNASEAVQVLWSLQQAPVEISADYFLLASLIVLHSNDEWWMKLLEGLDYAHHTWSILAAAQIAWVIIAYIFTVADAFTRDITIAFNSNGQAARALWIWLLAIVTGWLQISPRYDAKRLNKAVTDANNIAYVAPLNDAPNFLARPLSEARAISLTQGEDPLYSDRRCTAPIYNYSRFLSWTRAVEEVSDIFRVASERASKHESVRDIPWNDAIRLPHIDRKSREGTRAQVETYCQLREKWGATGAAVLVVWLTPTTGLGCRSGAYLLYGVVSTVVWMMLVLSSFLSHFVSTRESPTPVTCFARCLSILLRRVGTILAALNTVWILATCVFQFSNFFDRCYCNSSVMGRGANAWNVIVIDPGVVTSMKSAWIGGVVLAAGTAACFILFVTLFRMTVDKKSK